MKKDDDEAVTDVPETRNAERTRRAILDATIESLLRKSAAMTIADVAEAAGVSKSGLLHHFPSRDALLLAVLDDAQTRLREEVLANLDLSENVPGKMLRAYVRTVCSEDSKTPSLLNAMPFWMGLEGVPGAAKLEEEDLQWWREQFLADGLDPTLVTIVRRATEGLAAAVSYGDENRASVQAASEWLIRATVGEGSMAAAS